MRRGTGVRARWRGTCRRGDLLRREPDGTLTFVDRKRYLIKTGGENVYPAEVEQIIVGHEAVQEVCVVGIPDSFWGEAVKAVIVLREGHSAAPAEIVGWCREHLASYKRPRFIEFLAAEQVPRSTTGKILRHELAKRPASEEQRV